MALQPSSILLRGGLDLVTPPMALPAGRAIAAMNYEPEARGYRRIGGFERFDGQPSPSLGANADVIAARRAAIAQPPGRGPIRGVCVFRQQVYAFRDDVNGAGQMFRATDTGWLKLAFGQTVNFTGGTVELTEGASIRGGTSGATATVNRVVLQSGQWDGTAAGYLVVTPVNGTIANEAVTDTEGGKASVGVSLPVALGGGGRYDFSAHNFYGSTRRPRLYFANGVDTAYEFDGAVLVPIRTGTTAGNLANVIQILTRSNATILTRGGDEVVLRGKDDSPTHIGIHSNHLFLAFAAGSLLHSGVGEPLDYRTTAGAGEISFGGVPTGILSSVSTSLVIFGQSRIEYLAGNDSDDFEMKPISDNAGAAQGSMQVAGEAPIYLDEGGLRRLTTTSAFGDWRMGSLSALIEPLFRAKREAGVKVSASISVKAKDQYRLFFDDGSGIVLYLGRKDPELMPIRFPAAVSCTCAGELDQGSGERIFVGSDDGFVYEIDRGTSFDGASVPAYIRLGWNAERAPNLEKRFHSARIETDSLSDMAIGLLYHIDYNASENLAGELRSYGVPAGSPSLTPAGDPFSGIDWTLASAGEIYAADLAGLGRNIAIMLISEHTAEDPHTLTAMTLNYSARRQHR